jgi:hypothetical protein
MERPPDLSHRPEGALSPSSNKQDGYLLEIFEQRTSTDVKVRHAIWLWRLKTEQWCWECSSCGPSTAHHELDAALLAEARAHFDQGWGLEPTPIWSPLAIWVDRWTRVPPPSAADLDKLATELAQGRRSQPQEAVNVCGFCGQTFQIAPDDPHWSTGRGPICPKDAPGKR